MKSTKRLSVLAVLIVQAALLVAIAAAPAPAADGREALRQRLDSLDVETQVRKRSGKPIDDLETASAMLRDSIVGMRSAPPSEPAGARDSSFLSSAASTLSSLLESAISFKPSGLFDWVIVGTGVIAVLSALLLFVGIVAGRRKKRPKDEPKRINLAPTKQLQALPDAPAPGTNYNFRGLPDGAAPPAPPPPQSQVPPEFESLLGRIREITPQPQPTPSPPPIPTPMPPPVIEPPLPPPLPPTPPPLFAEAPDSAPSTKARANLPKAGSPGFSDSIAADAKNGLSDVEISRRYHISVDQVRLMLRMRQD